MDYEQIKVELCSSWGNDRNAAEQAWASSYSKETAEARSEEDVSRVVRGLVDLAHDTPKERLWLDFYITVPIFIERQFDKYRMTVQHQQFSLEFYEAPFGRNGISQNELSGRYRTIPDRPYRTPSDVARIGKKAGIPSIAQDTDAFLASQHHFYQNKLNILKEQERAGAISNAEYKRAREVLRGVLGTGFMTDMRIVLNLNAFEHIVNQRIAPDAQFESQVLAYQMIQAVRAAQVAPTMVEAMVAAHGWEERMAGISIKMSDFP